MKSLFGRTKRIYLDHASATPVDPQAARACKEAFGAYANPGGIHGEALGARRLLTESRESIARHLGCKAREIIFTSGLTEANNIALVGLARAIELRDRSLKNTHWIVSSIEHSSVLECAAEIERMGGEVSHVEPDPKGIISPERVAALLRPNTVLVSIGWGNNEIGTVQPLSRIARVLRTHEKMHHTNILLHSDAGQAPLYRSPQVHSLGVDLLSLGSGKLYGPRGIGCLYLGNRATLAPIIFGGGQERGLRSGTEDVALAAGFATALDMIALERESETRRLKQMRDDFARKIIALTRGAIVNGDLRHALPHMLNVSIPGERTGEYLTLALDAAGLLLSTKSACREGEAASHVVAALAAASEASAKEAGESWRARNTLRFSLGRATSMRDLARALAILEKVLPT